MRYLLALLPVLLIIASCGDDDAPSTTPTLIITASASHTPAPSQDKGLACEDYNFPTAALTLNDVSVSAHKQAINWNDPVAGCGINGHPFDTITLPGTSVSVPVGATITLAITRDPTTSNASAWTIDVASLGGDYRTNVYEDPDIVEIANYTEMREGSLVDLDIQAAATQQLDLSDLPSGDTIIEVGASWPEGGIRWLFRLLLP